MTFRPFLNALHASVTVVTPKLAFLKSSLLTLSALIALSACGKDESVVLNSSAVETENGDTDNSGFETDFGAGGGSSTPPARPTPTPTTPTTPTAPAGPSPFAEICDSDGDCADGLRCMRSSSSEWLDGGPAHGYCTLDCATDPNTCIQLDPSAVCLGLGDAAYCMQGCALGDTAAKCQGRGDLACDAASIGVGFCRPMCRSDADCDDRLCDVGSGSCVDSLLEGDPIGAECDPEGTESTCQSGICFPVSETFATCAGLCNLSEIGCGSDNDVPEEPGEPICLFPAVDGSRGGDLGVCNQRCECDGDCLHPDALCMIVTEDLQAVFGSSGLCVDPEWPAEEQGYQLGQACPEGPAQSDVDSGGASSGSDSGTSSPGSGQDASTAETDPPAEEPAEAGADSGDGG